MAGAAVPAIESASIRLSYAACMSDAQDRSTSARDAAAAVHAHIVPATLEFSCGRTSFAKRRILAGEFFPDEYDQSFDAVVEMAENLHWIAVTRG